MKSIQIIKFKDSQLSLALTSVTSIEIDDNAFDSGAFGEIYYCISINGIKTSAKQVIKIFIDDGTGSASRGFSTVNQLQDRIVSYNKVLKQGNLKSIENIHSLDALPQISFEGVLNGKKIYGYSANYLNGNEWLLFGKIFNEEDALKRKELRNSFYQLPLDHRLKFAYDLAEGFLHLEKMNFIYADLNPQNFFVNQKEGKLCIIDYEGGAINENPEIFGKPGEWLAPEIQEQLLANQSATIKVDLNTDTWAVAIGIHFTLFNFHPLFFLKIRGKTEMREYFSKYMWPNIDKNNSNFRNEISGIYDLYIDLLKTEIPKEIYKGIFDTINKGYNNPNLRLSYKQWLNAIGGLMQPPIVSSFSADRTFTVDGLPVTLSWDIKKAHTVFINNGVGEVTGKLNVKVIPNINTTYTLTAIGHFGQIESSIEIKVFPTPVIQSLFVPAPNINYVANIKMPDFNSVQLDFSIKIDPQLFSIIPDKYLMRKEDKFNISNLIDQIKLKVK